MFSEGLKLCSLPIVYAVYILNRDSTVQGVPTSSGQEPKFKRAKNFVNFCLVSSCLNLTNFSKVFNSIFTRKLSIRNLLGHHVPDGVLNQNIIPTL